MFSWLNFFKKKTTVPTDKHWIADVSIAGLQHYRGNDLAELIQIGDALKLQQQPDNAYDNHAIIVLWHNNKIGYIPAALARDISRKMEAGVRISASIIELKSVRFGRKWIRIRLQAEP